MLKESGFNQDIQCRSMYSLKNVKPVSPIGENNLERKHETFHSLLLVLIV